MPLVKKTEGNYPDAVIGFSLADLNGLGISDFFMIANMGSSNLHCTFSVFC